MTSLTKVLIIILFLLAACSGAELAEQEKMRQQNAHGERISRHHGERLYPLSPPTLSVQESYPWKERLTGVHPRITKEYFRCKGNPLNPIQLGAETIIDCRGREGHSLPVREGREFIYPILIDLLNYVQSKTGKKVIITSAHRCPAHNRYADSSSSNRTSKHMVGAEVDFYVQGMEGYPQEIINLLMGYYRETSDYENLGDYQTFLRYEGADTNVSTPPWYNKEVLLKLVKKEEGRDLDNRHPYPYVTIQVRYDRERKERVNYTWPKAHKGYLHY